MIVFFTVSFIAGSTVPYLVQEHWVTLPEFFAPSHILLVIAFVMLILAETGKLPVDHPSGHFELAMIERTLTRNGVDYIRGKTWTSDGYYREAPEKVRARPAKDA